MKTWCSRVAVSLLVLSVVGCNAESVEMSGTSSAPRVSTSTDTSNPETTTSSSLPPDVSLIQVFGGSTSEQNSLALEDGTRPEWVQWSYMTAVTVGGPGLVAGGVLHSADAQPTDAAVWVSADAQPTDAAVWVSPDGRSWTRIDGESGVFGDATSSADEPSNQAITDLAGGSLGVVAVGTDGLASGKDGAVWVSSDGRAWERVLDEDVFGGEGDQIMHSVVQVAGQVVVVGESGGYASAWVSSDGRQWDRAEVNDASIEAGVEPSVMNDVAATRFGLVAVGSSGLDIGPAVWLSADGATWDRLLDSMAGPESGFSDSDSALSPMTAVAASDHGFVAIGTKGRQNEPQSNTDWPWTTNGPLVWTSADGYEWRLVDSTFLEVASDRETSQFAYMKRGAPVQLEDVAWVGDRMIAIGGYENLGVGFKAHPRFVTVWISTDGGSTWHPTAETSLPLTDRWRGARAFTQFDVSFVLVGNDDIPAGKHPKYGYPTWADTAAVWIADAADGGFDKD